MISDSVVLSRIASQWRDGGLFDSPYMNLVGQWAVNFVSKFGEAPNGQIQAIFEDWANKHPNEKMVEAIERFLISVSDQHARQETPPTSDYLLDVAGRYFNKVKMQQVMESALDDLDVNRTEDAYGKLASLTRVELGKGALIKPAEDYDAWRKAFDRERRESLVSYPGRMGKVFGSAMSRDSLIAFMSIDKTGKSFCLLDLAYRVVRDRRRVAYFECGDNGEAEVLMRLGERTCRKHRNKGSIQIPTAINEQGKIKRKTQKQMEGLTPQEGYKAFSKISRGKDLFRLSCHPNSSISVTGISSILKDWEREGWVADAIVIDYADILAPPEGVRETLDQIDATWRLLRRLSQTWHALVVTATQSNATAYSGKQRLLGRQHFSGRKTKLAHVNGMIGINVSSENKTRGVMLLNWVVKREGRYSERMGVTVAGCLAIANPAIRA